MRPYIPNGTIGRYGALHKLFAAKTMSDGCVRGGNVLVHGVFIGPNAQGGSLRPGHGSAPAGQEGVGMGSGNDPAHLGGRSYGSGGRMRGAYVGAGFRLLGT